MEEIKGLVSVTIPFYNAERFLRETVESVLAQTYPEWEVLLVDDGSTDGSTAIAQSYAATFPDKIFYLEHSGHRNLGVNAARNLGARHSRGEFLAFLDSDDIWLPTKLEISVASMVEHPEAGFLFGSTVYWYEWDAEGNNHKKNEVPMLAPGEALYRPPALLLRSFPLGDYGAPCPCSFLLRRRAFERIGGFDECFNPSTYQIYEDVAFLAKVYLNVPIFVSGVCLDKNRCSRFSMTRQAKALRDEEAARRFYFRWLASYLRENRVTESAIWRAVRWESWFYWFPLPVAAFLRRLQRKLKREFARIREVKADTATSIPSLQTTDRASAPAADRYSVEAITTEAALDDLEDDWNRLSASSASPNVFMAYSWFRAWLRRLTADEGSERLQPYVLVIRQNENVVGIAPLVRRVVSRLGVRVRKLEFVTSHADYNDTILGEDLTAQAAAVAEFLSYTSEQWDFVDLRDLRETRDVPVLIKNMLAHSGLPYRILPEGDPCPYLPTDGDAANVMKRLSGPVRRTLRKRSERAMAEGLRSRIIENPEQEPELLKKLIALDHQKQLHRMSPSFIGTYPEVFQTLIDNLGPRGWLYVALLELGARPVAFQVGFRCGNNLWDYAKAFDRSFARFAPGTLLLLALLDYGYEQGFGEYDFLRGEDPHKTLWGTGCHHRVRFLLWNRRWKSRLGAFAYFRLGLGRRR